MKTFGLFRSPINSTNYCLVVSCAETHFDNAVKYFQNSFKGLLLTPDGEGESSSYHYLVREYS